MRKGKHAVCSDHNITNSILEFAKDNEVNLHTLGVDFYITGDKTGWQWWTESMMIEGVFNSLIKTDYQLRNLSGALRVLELLKIELKQEKIQKALDAITLKGRFQVFKCKNKEWVIDVAHNNQASINLVKSAKKFPAAVNNLGVFGLQKTKRLQDFFEPLIGLVDLWFLPDFNEANFWSANEIEALLKKLGVSRRNIFVFKSTSDAVGAINLRSNEDRVLVAGSFVVVKNVLEEIEAK